MQAIISPVLPFPNILWWSITCSVTPILFDLSEHFEKMSYRNRYYITGPNGIITLSVPLAEGREQRRAMQDVRIDNKTRWQVQHWRTLTSVYNRSPFFEHYGPSLQRLFTEPFEKLVDFNMASIHWLKQQLRLQFEEKLIEQYQKEHTGVSADLRKKFKPGIEKKAVEEHAYYQLFSERNGFLRNLSLLDLLFTEGPHSLQWLKINKEMISSWERAKL
jgi:hypothetical protein